MSWACRKPLSHATKIVPCKYLMAHFRLDFRTGCVSNYVQVWIKCLEVTLCQLVFTVCSLHHLSNHFVPATSFLSNLPFFPPEAPSSSPLVQVHDCTPPSLAPTRELGVLTSPPLLLLIVIIIIWSRMLSDEARGKGSIVLRVKAWML